MMISHARLARNLISEIACILIPAEGVIVIESKTVVYEEINTRFASDATCLL